MRDMDVRAALHARLLHEHGDDPLDTLVVDELGLCGEVRVDVAVVNGSLTGFELKSARDNLRRLPKQVLVYSQVLDYAELVVADNHVKASRELLPKWWGISVATADISGAVTINRTREARRNPTVDPHALSQLLWRDEALDILTNRGADRGVRSKPRRVVWARLAETLELEELRDTVRACLKARTSWRADARSALGVSGSPIAAKS